MSEREMRQITRYLLGEMPAEEADRLEARMLAEPQLFELAEVAEDDLVDRYARGELAPQERRRFERRLLPSERIRERLAFARLVAAWPRWSTRSSPVTPDEPVPSGGRLRGFFATFSRAPARLAWAAALVAAIGAGVLALNTWRLETALVATEQARAVAERRAATAEREATGPEAPTASAPPVAAEPAAAAREPGDAAKLETELAATRERVAALEQENESLVRAGAERRRPVPGKDTAPASAFLPLATRSASAPTPLALKAATHAELALDLGGLIPEGTVDAAVTHRDVVIWWERGLPLQVDGGDSVAILTLPRQALRPGRYRIDLTVSGRLTGSYVLEIEN